VIRAPREDDQEEFLACVRRSRRIHRPWVSPPDTAARFRRYLAHVRGPAQATYFVFLARTGELAGVVNVSEIVRGNFRSAYLGYYAFFPHEGSGAMAAGLRLVISTAFRKLKLHRLEANIQPANHRSIALARRLGFRKEGVSPSYLKIGGRWRDHERWAILADEWRSPPSRIPSATAY
jgi:ribosomal-protein-alanine N-acetyltransferase